MKQAAQAAAAPSVTQAVRQVQGGIELDLQVVPRASRQGLGPIHGGRVKVHVSAPPVDGAANEAVRELLAAVLSVGRGQVTLVRGETGRKKTVRIDGDPRTLQAHVEAALAADGAPKTGR